MPACGQKRPLARRPERLGFAREVLIMVLAIYALGVISGLALIGVFALFGGR